MDEASQQCAKQQGVGGVQVKWLIVRHGGTFRLNYVLSYTVTDCFVYFISFTSYTIRAHPDNYFAIIGPHTLYGVSVTTAALAGGRCTATLPLRTTSVSVA